MTSLFIILAFIGGFIACLVLAKALGWGTSSAAEKAAEAEAKKILTAARNEVEELKRSAAIEGKEVAHKIKAEAEEHTRGRKKEINQSKEELAARRRELEKDIKKSKKIESDIERRERAINSKESAAEAAIKKAEAVQQEAKGELENIAKLSAEEARARLEELMVDEARKNAATAVKTIQDEAEAEAAEKSKQIIATAIQRYASEFVGERTVSVVALPSDDMKGRLIGREGRNIRALEAAAGIDLIIDDTSEAISISCFNPVRREIARLAIGKLVSDGRIHPTRIEEVVASSERAVQAQCKEAGEQAVFDLGLHKIHPELVLHLGTLKFRTSYASNLLQHSVEVGFLSGLLAAELGISVKQARRAGLLHDIGKGVDHQHEGDHAEVGAAVARKHGESPKICQAIAHHHEGANSVLEHIVDAANRLSSARPGARREVLASYIKRLEDLEEVARGFNGVHKVFAVQAGREVRVMVHNDKVSDAEAHLLSRDIARKIELDATYAGQVRVVVIRETRASDYAQ